VYDGLYGGLGRARLSGDLFLFSSKRRTGCKAVLETPALGDGDGPDACVPCPAETYSAEDDVPECAEWTTCSPGQYVSTAGTSTMERQCETCELGTVSPTENASACAPAQVAAGAYHTCALLTNGSVRCWGRNTYGPLGYGNTITIGDDEAPKSAGDVKVGGAVTQIAAGSDHTCALLTNGNVRCWGDGSYAPHGYGNTNDIGDNETPASVGDVPYL